MTSSKFELKELVTVENKEFPVVGGRLRLAHAEGLVSITTELVHYSDAKIVMRATVTLPAVTTPGEKRTFTGHGEADVTRDSKLKEAIIELAETRAIARALRMAGFGLEFTGAEEVSHVRNDDDAGAPAPSFQARPAPSSRGFV